MIFFFQLIKRNLKIMSTKMKQRLVCARYGSARVREEANLHLCIPDLNIENSNGEMKSEREYAARIRYSSTINAATFCTSNEGTHTVVGGCVKKKKKIIVSRLARRK